MEILNTILEYLPMILVAVILIVAAILIVAGDKNKIKHWLVWAVSDAESYLGSGTGKLKLRYVYDMFVTKFPFISTFITFEVFSIWVDEALIIMKNYIATNENIERVIATTEKE